MSVKYALLALLSSGPSSTYQLRKDFDLSTGQTWPLNIGQVSTTLQRLERDGLVVREVTNVEDSAAPDPWHLTDAGRDELDGWWRNPVLRTERGRDELVIKLALAVAAPGVDVVDLVQRQRSATLSALHDVTRLLHEVEDADLAARLVLNHHVFATEADLRWLDDVEGSLVRIAAGRVRGERVVAGTAKKRDSGNSQQRAAMDSGRGSAR